MAGLKAALGLGMAALATQTSKIVEIPAIKETTSIMMYKIIAGQEYHLTVAESISILAAIVGFGSLLVIIYNAIGKVKNDRK